MKNINSTQQLHAGDQQPDQTQEAQTAERPKEQSPPRCKDQVQQAMTKNQKPEKPVVRRENYCKFERVEKPLAQMLERSVPEKEIAANLNISLPTLHKYKNLLAIRDKKIYITPEEERFLKKHTTITTPPASSAPAKSEKGGKS